MKFVKDPIFWGALAGGVVLGVLAQGGAFGEPIQMQAVKLRELFRFIG